MNQQIKNLQYSEDWFNYQRFYDEIASKKFNVLVELGTWKGHSISYLGKKLLEQSYDFKLYGVDLFDDSYIHTKEGNSHLASQMKYIYDVYNQNLIDAGVREVIKDIKGNTWEVASQFEDNSVDFVFIDADHNYESVKKDILSWLPKMKKGGIMSGHDYFNNTCGVKQAVDEIFPNVVIGTNNIWMVEI